MMKAKGINSRVVVFAYSEVGYSCLSLLFNKGVNVIGVFTHKDDPAEEQWFRSVEALARKNNVPVYTPDRVEELEWLAVMRDELRPDIIFSFYYRYLIPMGILGIASAGAYNMHGSLLPLYRGRAPVNWAVLNGEHKTGATLHHMTEEADAGDVVDQQEVSIGPSDSAAVVMERVRNAAELVLARQLEALLNGKASSVPQDHGRASVYGGRKPADGRINWNDSAVNIFNLIRAVTKPFPGAFSDEVNAGRRLLIWWAEPLPGQASPGEVIQDDPMIIGTGDGCLKISEFQWVPLPSTAEETTA